MQLLPAALRALSAALLADGKGRWQQHGGMHVLCLKLLAHPRAAVFLDVVFDATRTLYRMVSACFLPATSGTCRRAGWTLSASPHATLSLMRQVLTRTLLVALLRLDTPESTAAARARLGWPGIWA